MFIKNCPFCFETVYLKYDAVNKMYYISCEGCTKKGIFLCIMDKDKDKVVSLWNTRVLDTALLNDPDYVINSIKQFNETINTYHSEPITLKKLNNKDEMLNDLVFDLTRKDYGFLITQNGSEIKCNDSHPEELFKYLNLEESSIIHLDDSVYLKLGLLRITQHANCVMIVLPLLITKHQIDTTFKLLEKYFCNFNLFCVYKEDSNTYTTNTFTKASDVCLFLNNII